MQLKQIEAYFYYQDEQHATVLIVDYQRKFVRKIFNYPPQVCMNDDSMQYISVETANILFFGLNKAYFFVRSENYNDEEPTEKQERMASFFDKINRKVNTPEYFAIIEEEYRLHDVFREKRMAFTDIIDKHNESILKINKEFLHECLEGFTIDENMPEAQRIDMIIERLKNQDKNGYAEVKKKMMQNKEYQESDKIAAQIQPIFMDFFKALIDVEKHASKEYEMYSDKYKEKMKCYAEQGLFLYCQNTPDLPLDDDDICIDDIYEYYLMDDAMYLRNTFEAFVAHAEEAGPINKLEADDIVASFNLLLEGKYWASLRNLYALIDHHHKLCADLFNGYEEMKRKFKNGKDRSEYIDTLFNQMKVTYYEEAWKLVNEAIEEMNKGIGKRFVSRNAIILGDYEINEVNPTSHDVVNVFMLYVTMRQMVDHMANIEEAVKYFESYCKAYVNLHLDKK